MSKLVLQYHPGRGLMEIPRQLLAIANKFAPEDFTDARISPSAGVGLESNLGRLPVLSVSDTLHIGQSTAINFYIASTNGLMGADVVEAARIISLQEHIRDLNASWTGLVAYGAAPTEEQLNEWFEGGPTDAEGVSGSDRARRLTWYLGRIEATLDSAGFAVGSSISLGDVLLYNRFGEYLKKEDAPEGFPDFRREAFGSKERTDAAVAKFPKIAASVAAVAGHLNIKRYLAVRGPQGF